MKAASAIQVIRNKKECFQLLLDKISTLVLCTHFARTQIKLHARKIGCLEINSSSPHLFQPSIDWFTSPDGVIASMVFTTTPFEFGNLYISAVAFKPRRIDRYLKNGIPKSIVHVMKHVNFQVYRAHPDKFIWKKLTIYDKYINKRV